MGPWLPARRTCPRSVRGPLAELGCVSRSAAELAGAAAIVAHDHKKQTLRDVTQGVSGAK
jgi:hypothetical protein